VRVTLDDQVAVEGSGDRQAFGAARDVELLALDEALTRLTALDPELGHLVELRYFGGLTVEETAEAMGSSPATVKRQWAVARAWLKRALDDRSTLTNATQP
jgi:RNA polymerase sigma factor (sigma-70 family)